MHTSAVSVNWQKRGESLTSTLLRMSARGVEYATERMIEAENAGDYVAAIWWADGRDRIIAAGHAKTPGAIPKTPRDDAH